MHPIREINEAGRVIINVLDVNVYDATVPEGKAISMV